MPDLLVRLYDLPSRRGVEGVELRPALPPEKHVITTWMRERFGPHWASECEVAIGHQPVGCHVALRGAAIVGVACWDATARGFFGPMGTLESERGKGIGAALLLECLHAMAAYGYAYAVIGGVGPKAFYDRVVSTAEIPGSSPGIYRGLLRGEVRAPPDR